LEAGPLKRLDDVIRMGSLSNRTVILIKRKKDIKISLHQVKEAICKLEKEPSSGTKACWNLDVECLNFQNWE
jgi:hypothetical protein